MVVTRDSALFIKTLLETSASDQLITYENSVLEKKYPEFRYLMNEFHDGILLFDVSNKKVWDRISRDSAGLHAYYGENKFRYMSKKQIEAKIYILKKTDGEKILAASYKKYAGKPDADNRLMEKFNQKNEPLLSISDSIWVSGDDPEVDKVEWIT